MPYTPRVQVKVPVPPVPPPPMPPPMTDAFLREFGFRVAARPQSGPPSWERAGRVYPEDLAHRIAAGERARALKQLESL